MRRELRRVLRKECRAACKALGGDDPASVHDARTHIKKARAAIRLVNGGSEKPCERLADDLQDAAHGLGTVREADANLETLDALTRTCRGSVHAASARTAGSTLRRRQLRMVSRAPAAVRRARHSLSRAEAHLPDALAVVGGGRTARDGLARSYRRARQTGRLLDPKSAAVAFHEWRKRVKDLWYHCRLFDARDTAADRLAKRLHPLESVLGEHHNLETLRLALVAPRGAGGARERALTSVLGCIAQRQLALGARALRLATPIFRQRSGAFRRQVKRWTT